MERALQIRRWQELLLITTNFLFTLVWSLEESQPAIFLTPRNFNPHPYETSYASGERVGVGKVGPVVFPPSPSEQDNVVNSNILTLGRERQIGHPVDNHPYPKVARKHKNIFPSRFSDEDNDINPRVYEALSNHAAKVLSEPASQLRKDYTLSSLSNPQERKNYAFSYKVVDQLTGDDFSHTQSQDSSSTNGEYRVKLPDGRVQIVSYVADKNGYQADVKYTEHEPKGEVRLKAGPYAYRFEERPALYYVATPKPPLYPKVEIYTGDNLADYVGSTVAPPYVLASTVAPSIYRYVSTPGLVRNQQGADLVYGK